MKILQTLRPLKTSRTVVYERSLLSSRWVFWEVMRRQGIITHQEHETYSYFYEQCSWIPDVYIFLSKSADLAWDHIQERHQAGDSGVTKEYWLELDTEYQRMLRNVPCKVHVVNANRSVVEIHKEICGIIAEHELLRLETGRDKVQSKSGRRREVSCTPFQNMCCVS